MKLLSLLFTVFFSLILYAQDYEHITNYHSDIRVEKNCDVYVTETIRVFANYGKIKRGIYRFCFCIVSIDNTYYCFLPRHVLLANGTPPSNSKTQLTICNMCNISFTDEKLGLHQILPNRFDYKI